MIMYKVGIIVLAIGIVLAGYGVKEEQHVKTKDIATMHCLSCLGLTPSGYGEGIEHGELEKLNHEIELIIFSAEWCKACPKAIAVAKEIAESSEFINYRVIKYEEDPEEFENFVIEHEKELEEFKNVIDLNGLPVTVVIIDGEITDVLDGAYKLDGRIWEVIEKFAEE